MFEALHLTTQGSVSFRRHDEPERFNGYHDYVSRLSDALKQLWNNATDVRRARPMRAVATASRGYDSPTVVALTQPIVQKPMVTWSSPRSNTRIPAVVQRLMLHGRIGPITVQVTPLSNGLAVSGRF